MALYAFDGTWNLRDGKDVLDDDLAAPSPGKPSPRRSTIETNVQRFVEFYDDGTANVEYLQGVGTRYGALGRVLGGAFGFGGRYRIRKMHRKLIERHAAGDTEIDIVGFSRGAALAVHFANLTDRYEIPGAGSGKHLLWWWYPGLGLTFRYPKLTLRRRREEVTPEVEAPVRVLALFDTVATFGFPLGPVRNVGRFWNVWTIPDTVARAFHAMALDERRKTFELVRPTMAADRLYEVWFRGAHANVGGGYADRGLSDIALAWMMSQARWAWEARLGAQEPAGFMEAWRALDPHDRFSPHWSGTRREALVPDPGGTVGRPRKARRKTPWRKIEDGARVHHTVRLRPSNLVADHYNVNRPLLQGLPPDVVYRYDPPFFWHGTTRELARHLADEAFHRIPVFPAAWCAIDPDDPHGFIHRGDDWVAQGTLDRAESTVRSLFKPDFDIVAEAWFEHAGDLDATVEAALGERDRVGDRIQSSGFSGVVEIVAWVRAVLEVMWPHLPRGGEPELLLAAFPEQATSAPVGRGDP